jgi:hypothetical protein
VDHKLTGDEASSGQKNARGWQCEVATGEQDDPARRLPEIVSSSSFALTRLVN